MIRLRFSDEQIIRILKEQKAGAMTADVCRRHGISEAIFYKWKARLNALVRTSAVYASSDRCWKSDLTARFIGFENSSAAPSVRRWFS